MKKNDSQKDRTLKFLELQRQHQASVENELDIVRKHLLIVSTVGIIISYTGAVPSKIGALGIEFGSIQQAHFLTILGMISAYFLCKFSLIAFSNKITEFARFHMEVKAATGQYEDMEYKPSFFHKPFVVAANNVMHRIFYTIFPICLGGFSVYKCLTMG